LKDIDGDPIVAPYVAGRQTLGGNDVGFSPKQFQEIAKKLVKVETVPRADINDASGRLFTDPDTMEPTVIRIADDLNETRRERVIAHELAHAIHAKTGFKPIIDPAMRNELERNFSILASGPGSKTLTRPSDIDSGYRDPIKSDRELVADAIYATLRKPNYGKTELPVFYKTLRQWIKSNPDLAKLLINNSIAAATVAAALGATGESNEATAAEASSPHAPRGNGPKNQGSLSRTFTPSRLGDGATKASADGLIELKKALFRRGLYPQAPGNGKFRDLVRALADLEARQEPQP
jgi:hypothetical protein